MYTCPNNTAWSLDAEECTIPGPEHVVLTMEVNEPAATFRILLQQQECVGLEGYYLYAPGGSVQKRCVDREECMSVGYISEADKLCLTYFQCALEGDGVVANNKCVPESEWVAQNDANLFLYYVTPARAGGIAKRGTANPCLPNGAYANVVYDSITYECTCKHSSLSLYPALTIDEDGKYSESCSLEEPGFYRLETKRGVYLVTLFACVWNSYYQGAGQRMCVSACSEGQSVKWWTGLDMPIGICKCDGGNTHFYDTKRNTCTTTAECTSNGGFVLSLDGKQCVTAHECGQIDDGYLGLNYYAYKDLGECIPEGPMMSLLGEELGINDYPEETA